MAVDKQNRLEPDPERRRQESAWTRYEPGESEIDSKVMDEDRI